MSWCTCRALGVCVEEIPSVIGCDGHIQVRRSIGTCELTLKQPIRASFQRG